MILRALIAAVLLAGLVGCQPVKGPSESGLPVYYAPTTISSGNGIVYPQP